jgi:hypothetical protein
MGVPTGGASGECPECPHWGSLSIPGYGVIEPTGHVQAIYIAVPGAASAYRLYSVDLKEIPGLYSPQGEGQPGSVIVGDVSCLLPLSDE